MKADKKVLISGYYGFDNSGDDAILKAIVKDFQKMDDKVKILVLSKRPSHTEKMYGIKAINRFQIHDIVKEMKNCDLFISGGGSLLQDGTSTRSIIYYLTLIKLALMNKKPVMIYANGIGPINKKFNRNFTRKILDKVDLITLRDEDSRYYLKELQVKNPNIYVTADPVFTLEPSNNEKIENIFKAEKIPLDKPLIGVSVREWKSAKNLISNISQAIEYMIKKFGVNVVLIPMHYPEDLEISKKVYEKITIKGCFVVSEKYSVEDIMGIIRRLDMIIAMRLHSLIYAATQKVPMVGLIYDPKIEGFLKFIEMKYMCNVENAEVIELCSIIDKAWNNKGNLKTKLKEKEDVFKEKALENVYMALRLINGR